MDHSLAVVLAAHPSLTGMSSGTGMSGSTAWSNSVRSRLYLDRPKGGDYEIDPDLRVLRVKKFNYGRVDAEIRLRWHHGCFIADGPTGGFNRLAAEANAERVFLDLLDTLTAQGRDVSPNRSSAFAPTVFAKHPNRQGVSKKEFEGAMERLLTLGRIRIETSGPPSRLRSRLVIATTSEDIEF
jgi:RecA-family ATPase